MKRKAVKKAPRHRHFTASFIEVKQGKSKFLVTVLPCWVLVHISYVAVRRQSNEEGAVQRPLNEKRVDKIRDYALAGGEFPAGMILNWTKKNSLTVSGHTLVISLEKECAQLIDGQHRVNGLEEALKADDTLRDMGIPVMIYRDLSTQECADIFLSINTEQKPVAKSLAYDLFGIASQDNLDPAAVRAADIAKMLHDDDDSPYQGLIKYSGDLAVGRYAKLGIPFSTFVNALKPLVSPTGILVSMRVTELVNQTKAVKSFFRVMQDWYGDQWLTRDNVFMHGAGIAGGIDFFKVYVIPYCNQRNSYSTSTIEKAMKLNKGNRISKKSTEQLHGKAMARTVRDALANLFLANSRSEEDIEF